MTWLWIILGVAAIGGIIGYFASNKDEKGEGCLGGMIAGGVGAGYIILQIFLALLGLFLLFKIGSCLFS